MPWLKSDDKMPENDKIWALSNACYRLYEAARFYAARRLTDGHVPADRTSALMPKPATKPQIDALVRARLWHRLPTLTCKSCIEARERKGAAPLPQSGFIVHDFLEYNPSRAEWTKSEQQRKAAGKRGADARWRVDGDGEPHGESHGESHGEPHGEPHGEMDAPYPVPRTPSSGAIAPVPSRSDAHPGRQEGADRLRDRGRREGMRQVAGAAAAVVAATRGRAAS